MPPPVAAAVHVNVKLSPTLTLPLVGQPEMVGALGGSAKRRYIV